MDRASERLSSCRGAFCAASTVTTQIHGICATAANYRPLEFIDRIAAFAPALRTMGGGITLSGGEPLLQAAFSYRLFAASKKMGLHTALDTSGLLGSNADDDFLKEVDLVLLDIKSWDPETYRQITGPHVAPTLRFAERLAVGWESRYGLRFGAGAGPLRCAWRTSKASPGLSPR